MGQRKRGGREEEVGRGGRGGRGGKQGRKKEKFVFAHEICLEKGW